MNFQQFKILCENRELVFKPSFAVGGGDISTDETASLVDPNQQLAPIIGGSKTFNIVVVIAFVVVMAMLAYLIYKQSKK